MVFANFDEESRIYTDISDSETVLDKPLILIGGQRFLSNMCAMLKNTSFPWKALFIFSKHHRLQLLQPHDFIWGQSGCFSFGLNAVQIFHPNNLAQKLNISSNSSSSLVFHLICTRVCSHQWWFGSVHLQGRNLMHPNVRLTRLSRAGFWVV